MSRTTTGQHTETWYSRKGSEPHCQAQIADEHTGRTLALTYDDKDGERAAFIVQAVNAHAALVAACERARDTLTGMLDFFEDGFERGVLCKEIDHLDAALTLAQEGTR